MNKKRLKDRRVQKTGTSYQDRIILETPPTGLAAVHTVAAGGHDQNCAGEGDHQHPKKKLIAGKNIDSKSSSK